MSIAFNNDYYADKTITSSFSLKNTRIGYDNIVESATLAASSSAGFEVDALNNPFTYDFWRSPVEDSDTGDYIAEIYIQATGLKTVDYVGIAKHNLTGRRVTLFVSGDGVTYTEHVKLDVLSNDAIMLMFPTVSAKYFKLSIGRLLDPSISADFVNQIYSIGAASDIGLYVQIAVLFIGQSLEMQRMIFGGHAPAKLYAEAELRPSTSEGGSWLGRSIIRTGAPCEYSYQHLTGAWYRANFDPFAKIANTKPFFIAWRPLGYAAECQYAWTEKPIRPQNTGPNDWLSVSFNVIGCD